MGFARAHLRSGSDQSRLEAYRCQRLRGVLQRTARSTGPGTLCSNSTACAESRPMNIALPKSTFASHIQLNQRTAITFIGMPGAFTSLLLQGVGPMPGPTGIQARQSRIDLNKGTEMRPATTGHHNERKPSGSDADARRASARLPMSDPSLCN